MSVSLPSSCPMVGGCCQLEQEVINSRYSEKPYAFIAIPYGEAFDDTESAIRTVLQGGQLLEYNFHAKKLHGRKIKPVLARGERFVGEGTCKICQLCWFADFGIAEIGGLNPNVMIEIGMLWGFGKRVIFTLHLGYTSIRDVPFDLGNQMLVTYQSIRRLGISLDDKVKFLLLTWPRRRSR